MCVLNFEHHQVMRRETLTDAALTRSSRTSTCKKEFFIENLLVRIHLIIVIIRWTSYAPWEFEFPFSICNITPEN